MATVLDCPACRRPIQLPDGAEGRAVRCPLCRYVIPARGAPVRAEPPPPEPLDDLEVLDDGPGDDLPEVMPAEDRERPRGRRGRSLSRARRLSVPRKGLPTELRREIDEEVSGREEVIWVGQPDPKVVLMRGLGLPIFGAVFAGVAMIFVVMGLTARGPGIFFSCVGFFFVLIGVAIICGPLLAVRRAKRTGYVLTDKRAIVLRPGLFSGFDVRSYPRGRLRSSMYRQRSWVVSGAGDLVMEERWEFYTYSTGRGGTGAGFRRVQSGFMHLRNVKEVEDIVYDTVLGDRDDD